VKAPVPASVPADDDPFTSSHDHEDQGQNPDQLFTSVSLGDSSHDPDPELEVEAEIGGPSEMSFEGLERSFGTGIGLGLGLDLDFGDTFDLGGGESGLKEEVEEVSSKVIPSPFMRSLNASPGLRKPATTSTPPKSRSKPSPLLPPIPRIASPPTALRNTSSPRIHISSPTAAGRVSSPLVDSSSSGGGRQRISREEVKRRLMKGRNASEEEDVEETEVEDRDEDEEERDNSNSNSNRLSVFTQDSRLSSISTESAVVQTAESVTLHVAEVVSGGAVARGGTPLKREDNFTYDGVMSIDPGVQAIDPPRPDLGKRAMTLTTWEMGDLDFGSMNMSMRLSFGGGEGGREGDVDVDMRSALDRLMDDVAGGSAPEGRDADTRRRMEIERERDGKKGILDTPDDSMVTEEDVSAASSFSHHAAHPSASFAAVERSVVMEEGIGIEVGEGLSRTASGSTIPPPPPPKEIVGGKDARKEREKMIIEKRRLMRRLDEEESMGFISPPRLSIRIGNKGGARMNRRRSRSTGDVRDGLLNSAVDDGELGDSIERELRKMGGEKSVSHRF
jgi:hypothetical protein